MRVVPPLVWMTLMYACAHCLSCWWYCCINIKSGLYSRPWYGGARYHGYVYVFVVLRNMTEMIHFMLGSSIYRWGIMCISKLAVDWWKLVGIRRLISGYFSGLATYWMMIFMLRHELSLDSSVIIQYLFYMLSLSWVNTTPSRASCVYTFGDLSTQYDNRSETV